MDHENLVRRIDDSEKTTMSRFDDISNMKDLLCSLQAELNLQQQRDRCQNIKNSGIPEKKNEDIRTIILSIAVFVNVQITSQDIEYMTRVQPRTKVPCRPRLIVARLRSRLLRDAIISGTRSKNGLTTKDINIAGD
ncbi:unnamed protein product [Diatraea saccharalis]|uniref:Uncharacterized protein n=1 Tax=Diatraea saccharalis TaxID=40085 RepID=A0A9N9WHH1_9NEOP|nr:unnamed protein product [Diatraea saccharalis]